MVETKPNDKCNYRQLTVHKGKESLYCLKRPKVYAFLSQLSRNANAEIENKGESVIRKCIMTDGNTANVIDQKATSRFLINFK